MYREVQRFLSIEDDKSHHVSGGQGLPSVLSADFQSFNSGELWSLFLQIFLLQQLCSF